MKIKVFNFDIIESIGLKRGKSTKIIRKNSENFIKWIISILKDQKEIEEGEKYNALCILMNKNNIDILHKYLDPMVWLDYSPVEDNNLNDNEYSIDLDIMLEKEE